LPRARASGRCTDAQGAFRVWSGREKTPRVYYLRGTSYFSLGSFVNAEEVWSSFRYVLISPKQPHVCEGNLTDLYHAYYDAEDGNIYCERRPCIKATWNDRVAVCSGTYPWIDSKPTGELVLCYQTPASQVAWKRSRDCNTTWEDLGVAIAGRYPIAIDYNGIQYCVAYISGTGQVMRRSQDYFSSLLTYDGATSALITAETNAERVAAVKMESSGRTILVGVPSGNVVNWFRSKNDGETWTQES